MQQWSPSVYKFSHSFLISIDLVQWPDEFSWLFFIEHVNDLLQFSCFNLLLVYHLPQTIDEPCLLLQSTILEFSLFELELSRFDAFDGLEEMCGMEKRNTCLNVEDLIIREGNQLFRYFIDQDAVTMWVDFFGRWHLLDLLHVLLLKHTLVLPLPFRLLIQGLTVHQR